MKDTLEMREVYTRALEQLMKEDERVVVVEADLSRGVNTLRLRDEFPGRHIDAVSYTHLIVFAPKYRRKVFYQEKREAVGKILRQLCEWKGVNIVQAEVCPDHVLSLIHI